MGHESDFINAWVGKKPDAQPATRPRTPEESAQMRALENEYMALLKDTSAEARDRVRNVKIEINRLRRITDDQQIPM